MPAFAPFTLTHGLAFACSLAAIIGFAVLGRHLHRRADLAEARRFEILLGLFTLLAALAVNLWWCWPGRFTWGKSLPLELCDLAFIVAGISMLWTTRWWQMLVVFWGLGLSTQGLVTPTLTDGPDRAYFYVFWYQHAAIVGAAVYHLVARGYRPTWGDYWRVCGVSYVYLAVAMLANHVLHANYGRVGADQPGSEKTIVSLLGEWPLRVVWIALLVHVVFAIVLAATNWNGLRTPLGRARD